MPQTFRDSGIEVDLDPLIEERESSTDCHSSEPVCTSDLHGSEGNRPGRVRSAIDLALSTQTVMTPRVVPSIAKKSSRALTIRDPSRPNISGPDSAGQSSKQYLLPYRFLTPSKVSLAKTIDDLFVSEKRSRENQQKRLALQPFLLSLIRGKHSLGHASSVVDQTGNIRDCRLSIDKSLVVGLKSNLSISIPVMEIRRRVISAARNDCFTKIPDLVFTMTPERHPETADGSTVTGTRDVWDAVYVYAYTPRHSCTHTLHIQDPDGYLYQDYTLDVIRNDPVLSFNDATFWPLAVAVDDSGTKRDQCIIYVAYRVHIAEFLSDGRYVKQLTSLKEGSYNQLALAARSNILAATVHSSVDTGSSSTRHHRIYVYHVLSGRKLYDIAADAPSVGSTARWLSVASVDDDHIMYADGRKLFEIDVRRVDVVTKLDLDDVGSVTRLCCRGGKYYLADSGSGEVKVYEARSGKRLSTIQIRSKDGHPVAGLRGLSVDKRGNVIICDCLTGLVWIYDERGQLLKEIRSEWEPIRWPLDIGLELDGDAYLYVVDHGNISIKKFRYL
ncbi:hypothetical protein LSH36_14g12088 [Paralvinella palmiformis]|uniref:Tripartite motif-containing protein 2 n=1 Tax=Paralvinella palmiformis TaxID=53620 RepID=A0AAD9KE55_9ANNE|nr:hypothetical protein LSH36_14g12088 [Paralvinella palmiformis]